MSIFKTFLVTILICVSTSFSSASEKLNNFNCFSLSSAKSCDRTCENIGKINFDTRPEENASTIHTVRFKENERSPDTLEGCTIESKSSWYCLSENSFSRSEHSMVNGQYWWTLTYKMLDGEDDVTQGCAKK